MPSKVQEVVGTWRGIGGSSGSSKVGGGRTGSKYGADDFGFFGFFFPFGRL